MEHGQFPLQQNSIGEGTHNPEKRPTEAGVPPGRGRQELAICTHIPSPSWTATPTLWVITEHQAELPLLYSSFPLARYFTRGSVYMSILISQLIPPSPSHRVHMFIFSVSLFLTCKEVHLYHFSKFHMYALCMIFAFSLSDFTMYNSL